MSLGDQIIQTLHRDPLAWVSWIHFDDLAGVLCDGSFTSEEAVVIACALRDLAEEGRFEVRMKGGGIDEVCLALN